MKVYVLLSLMLVSLAAGQVSLVSEDSAVVEPSPAKPEEASPAAAAGAVSASPAPESPAPESPAPESPAPAGKAKPAAGKLKRGRHGEKKKEDSQDAAEPKALSKKEAIKDKSVRGAHRSIDGRNKGGIKHLRRHQEEETEVRRTRRSAEGQTLALLSGLLAQSSESESDSSSSSSECSSEANTDNRLVDQINLVMAKLMNCKQNNGYPYYGYPYYYNPCYYY